MKNPLQDFCKLSTPNLKKSVHTYFKKTIFVLDVKSSRSIQNKIIEKMFRNF